MSQATSKATELLREKILAGHWEQGERLAEVELAELFQVSRTPVREALARLASEGLVTISPNRGARVSTWSAEQVSEIFKLRLLLEPVASADAVGKLSSSDIDGLELLAHKMHELGTGRPDRDFVELAKLNRTFHSTVLEASGSPRLFATLTSVTHISLATQNYNHYTEQALSRSLVHHFEIVAALRVGEPDWVESVVRCHLHNARTAMLAPSRKTAAAGVLEPPILS